MSVEERPVQRDGVAHDVHSTVAIPEVERQDNMFQPVVERIGVMEGWLFLAIDKVVDSGLF